MEEGTEVPAGKELGRVTMAQPTAVTWTAATRPSSHMAVVKVFPNSGRWLRVSWAMGRQTALLSESERYGSSTRLSMSLACLAPSAICGKIGPFPSRFRFVLP